ncbi:YadA-like family protein [Bartonella sp. Coyote22sub2]|uniref:YadA-like family protein n=1 Tax=Bartonella sp. Coyote22sub2 TaxID=1933911 RepID=UPI0009C3DB76|nr:YadA-like family protein [Bartonella sp. Coyote22sub2]AQX24973.1 YadA-like C-terminal region [Bartonella sp. Coyote22sub2]
MKRSYLILKSGDLREYSFSRRSPLLKAASLGTAMAALLSSVAPVVASNFSPTEQQTTIQSSQSLKGTGVTSLKAPEKASKKSRDSVFASDRYCGIDNIVVSNSSDSKKIISEESYVNLLTHHKFDNWCSHGFGVQQATWTVDGKNTVLDVYETRVLSNRPVGGVGTLLPESTEIQIGKGAGTMPRSYSIAIGANTHVTINNSVALGAGSIVSPIMKQSGYDPSTGSESTKDDYIWQFNYGIVSIAAPTASKPTSRLLTGVAAGIQETDAVNVAQLQALRQWTAKIADDVSTHLGGGADILSAVAPTYKIQGSNHRDVGSAFKGVDGSISDLYSKIANGAGDSLVQQEKGNGRITIGSKVGGTAIDLTNKEGKGRTLSGLADGKLSDSSTEAVTGKQLYDVDTKLTKTTQDVTKVQGDITKIQGDVTKVQGDVTKVQGDVTKVQGEVATIAKNTSAYLGGGADILGGKAPTYKIQGSNHRDVGSAFVGVDGLITDLYSKIAGVAGGSLVEQEQEESSKGRITIGSKVGGTEINLLNNQSVARVLSGLGDGAISEGSNQAVTGNQLYLTNKKVSEYLGGGAGYEDGEWVDPTFTINVLQEDGSTEEKEYKNVADALKDISSSFTTVVETNLIQQEESEDESGRILIGSKVGGTEVNLTNKDGEGRTLSGLKDGKLSDSSTEAVTGKQLYEVDTKLTEKVSDVSKNVADLSTSMDKVQGDVTKVQGEVSTIAKNASAHLGGGADILSGEAPTYKIQGSNHHDVGSAFVGVDGSITDLYSKIAGVAGGSLVEQEQEESSKGRITIGSKVGGTEINLLNNQSVARVLSGLGDGAISEGSNQAVTGNQLYLTNKKVSEYLGGGAGYEDGEWVDPTFTINVLQEDGSTEEKEYKNVADALKDISSSFTTVVATNLIQQEESEDKSGRITIGSKTGGSEVNLTNKDGEGRTLSGLKDGELSDSSTEAVTGKQLYDVDTKLTKTTQDVTKIQGDVTKVQGNVSTIAKNASAYLGGGADILGGKAPTYKIQGSNHHDVGSAFVGVDGLITDLYSKIAGVAGGSLVEQEQEESSKGRITIGSKVGGTEINLLNNQSVARVLSGLGDGAISEGSNQAVTGNQLYLTNKKVSVYLGGGAGYEDGEWVDPTFTINVLQEDGSTEEKEYKNVADALKDISSSFTTVVETNLIQQEESEDESGRITIGAKTGGTEINLTNQDGEGRTLSGLKDGELSENSTEAVTGKQLYEVDSKLTKTTQNVANLSTSMDKVQGDVTKIQGDVSTIANNTSKYLGGGSNILGGEAPTYKVQNTEHHDVGSAFAGVDGSITDIYSKIASVAGGSLVEQEQEESGNGRILIGSKVGGTAIDLTNQDGEGRTLSGLKDGTLSDSSTEAVTGKQLYEVDNKLTKTTQDVTKVQDDAKKIAKNASSYLGGGADILGGIAPSYKVQGNDYSNVGEAFAGVDSSLSDIYKELSGSGSKSLVQQEEGENDRITIGAKTGGTEISLLNNQSVARVLSGLGDGAISEGSNQAVTGNQLYETNTKLAAYLGGGASYEDGQWADPTFTINVLQEDGSTEEKEYKNVADALKDISSSFTTVVETNLIQQEESEDESGRITIGANTGGTEINLTNKDGEVRTLSGLKDGELSDSSTEAVTGKQLYEVDSNLKETKETVSNLSTSMDKVQGDVSTIANNTSKYLGGGADILGGIAPSYKVQGNDYSNVGEAFAGVDSSFSDIYKELSGSGSKSLVQKEKSEDGSGRITIGAKTGGTEISLLNNQSVARVLSGLGDGAISEGSNQAVTGNQLYLTNKKVSEYLGGGAGYEDGKWVDPTFTINVLQEDGSTEKKEYKNVADALENISSSFTTALETNLIQQEKSEDESGRITIGANTGGTEVNLTNKDGEGRTLSGLKDGTLSASSTEAITGAQLYKTNTRFDEANMQLAKYLGGGAEYKDGVWTGPTFNIVQFNFGGKGGGPEDKEYKSVASAFDGVNEGLKNLNNRLDDVKNQVEQTKDDTIKWDENKGAYNAKHNGKEATITGVKDGDVSEGSTEAVTGNQLWNTNQKVDKLENEFNDFKNETGQKAEGAVQYDKDKDGKKTNKVTLVGGDASAPVVIDNVGDGKVEKDSKEAINGGQLYEKMAIVLDDSKKYTDEKVQEAKDYTDMKFESLNYNIEGVKKEARQAAAIGLAAANLRYEDAPGALSVAFSSGSWHSQSAIAFGAGYTSESGDIRSNFSVTTAGGHWGIGAGISVRLK